MGLSTLLVANRGEVAVRVLRAATDLGMRTVAVHSADDAGALHVRLADVAVALPGEGPPPYLDRDRLVAVARETGCDAVHPGWGFLSEDAAFAAVCADAGLVLVGPGQEVLRRLGDKTAARALAAELGVPVPRGTGPVGAAAADDAAEFLASLEPGGAVVVKAVAGGGGRGMRVVRAEHDLAAAVERCRAEALTSFGDDAVHLEELVSPARHVEVQLVGDGTDVVCLGDRDCSLQRGHQKLVEIAPAPLLDDGVRSTLRDAATRIGSALRYEGVGTVEFLVAADGRVLFLEANPRLQVEHTVTEVVTGVDLVRAQLLIAGGARLADVGLDPVPLERGLAVQARIGLTSGGVLTAFQPATGPGVRVDTHAFPGYEAGVRFDPLLAKLVVHEPSGDLATAVARTRRALGEFVVEGVPTTIPFLRDLLAVPEVAAGRTTTALADSLAEPVAGGGGAAVPSPVRGTVVQVEAAEGDVVAAGAELLVVEAMKMHHAVTAGRAGVVRGLSAAVGDVVDAGDVLVTVDPADEDVTATPAGLAEADPDEIRPDLAEVLARHEVVLDAARGEAVAARHAAGRRTARENVADLCDEGSFVEFGALAVAAQRRRRSLEELITRTPADGMVAGIGAVDGRRCVVTSYDHTVLAGTQGVRNHAKKDRMFDLAERERLPVVLFAEGGGGRPGDTDHAGVSWLDCTSFHAFARLSGLVPLVGVVSGRCFAGNAVLLGSCDVIIATPDANIGMGGPAMISGGGLGEFRPEEIGPVDVQVPNGVVDVAVADEAEAVAVARRYLSYFGGPVDEWECADQRLLRHAVPENRKRAYDVRAVVDVLADTGSVLELRPAFGRGIVTALVRVQGRPLGLLANDPAHLGGAIDADAADKASRFLTLCDAFDLPVVSLCDTPGFLVGPDAERTATVRRLSRLVVTGANLDVPFGLVVLRKAYGLGAQAMAAGALGVPRFAVSWPTGEFGPMGVEGAVALGYRRELAAVEDPDERRATFESMVAAAHEHGKALNVASAFEIDDVIDPAETRRWIATALTPGEGRGRRGKKRPHVDVR
ncbi:carboxyl transferase domain-containing protein [Umezawaea beigongshangensis]|uniref:carboxyl transferase domain-containing protein n=1 Tax=Umezawaea beigongshangensis TaxID=2780383 RepID=UPI0018F138FA|nr:carboxyl transferase domain-containing protein [Umezawaea beigongshangensis]